MDAVYYWPALNGEAYHLPTLSAPVALFSLTKLTGHAASRFGWAVVEDKSIAERMASWLQLQTFAVSIESFYRARILVNYLISSNGNVFFNYVQEKLAVRWGQLEKVVAENPAMTIESKPLTQYGWIKVANLTDDQIKERFAAVGLEPQPGTSFGSPGYVRFNLMEYSATWTNVLNRLKEVDLTP